MKYRDELYQLIAKGRTSEALENCIRVLSARRTTEEQPASSAYREVIVLSNRWRSLEEKVRLGILPVADEHLEKNRISNSLLTLLDEYAGDFEPTDASPTPDTSSQRQTANRQSPAEPRKKPDAPPGDPQVTVGYSGKTYRGVRAAPSTGVPLADGLEGMFQAIANNKQRSQKGQNLQVTLPLTEQQLRKGTQKRIKLAKMIECPACAGTGAKDQSAYTDCATCRGRGVTYYERPGYDGRSVRHESPCANCRGTGRIVKEVCRACLGHGISKEKILLTIDLPAGLREGDLFRFPELGDTTADNRPAGDLYLAIREK